MITKTIVNTAGRLEQIQVDDRPWLDRFADVPGNMKEARDSLVDQCDQRAIADKKKAKALKKKTKKLKKELKKFK